MYEFEFKECTNGRKSRYGEMGWQVSSRHIKIISKWGGFFDRQVSWEKLRCDVNDAIHLANPSFIQVKIGHRNSKKVYPELLHYRLHIVKLRKYSN